MRPASLLQFIFRSLLVLLAAAGLFVGIAFLPGSVEGNYRGLVSSCGCDGISFTNLREGKVMTYFTAHPPASLDGYYSESSDGSVELFCGKWGVEDEYLRMTAYPRLLITKFEDGDGGNVFWSWKWPSFGRIGEALAGQEIVETKLEADHFITRKVFDHDLNFLRSESKSRSIPRVNHD